ncbi:MAG TPA: adenylate kinase [Bryobacteraceae bacterium]|jgi:adenylate kinase
MSRLCLILFGSPGSGKGTQAKFLRQTLEVAHISTGDMLRERVASGDGLGREVAALMQAGSLVPDATVNRMVEERIEQADCEHGFILDGYPRTVDQARLLKGLLEAKQVSPLVVHLKVDYNVIVARLSNRRLCPTCGALYSVTSASPGAAEVCDYDGSKLMVREDDREEVVLERLRAYERQTAPVLDYFRSVGYPFLEIQGDGAPQVIAGKIGQFVEQREKIGNASV